jgi:hypothetical protein
LLEGNFAYPPLLSSRGLVRSGFEVDLDIQFDQVVSQAVVRRCLPCSEDIEVHLDIELD